MKLWTANMLTMMTQCLTNFTHRWSSCEQWWTRFIVVFITFYYYRTRSPSEMSTMGSILTFVCSSILQIYTVGKWFVKQRCPSNCFLQLGQHHLNDSGQPLANIGLTFTAISNVWPPSACWLMLCKLLC
jgi:hypothetical protein